MKAETKLDHPAAAAKTWSINSLPLEVLSVIGLFVLWLVLTQTIVPPLIFPSPQAVFATVEDRPWTIVEYAGATTARVVVGFLIGSALGVLNGISLHMNPVLGRISDPIVEILRPVPPIAMMPFIIIWFGIGDLGKVIIVAAGCSTILLVNTVEAIRRVNPNFVHAARSLGASKQHIYRTIVIPAILPSVFAGLRVALALSFTLTIAAEFMGAQTGLGFMIMLARRYLDTASIVAGIIIIGVLSLGMDRILRSTGKHLLRWSPQTSSW
jgi:taurine transport system permease protein